MRVDLQFALAFLLSSYFFHHPEFVNLRPRGRIWLIDWQLHYSLGSLTRAACSCAGCPSMKRPASQLVETEIEPGLIKPSAWHKEQLL